METPRIISLFTGVGGLDYGFEAAGFRTAVALEYNAEACRTLRHNRDWPVIEDDVHRVSTCDLLSAAGLRRGEPSVLIGGPPCQPFSKSGYWANGDAKRLDDPRSGTLGAFLRILEEALPQAFLLENVQGISYSEKDEGLDLILRSVQAINRRTGARYRPCFQVLKAAEYGVPQLRERFFMIASREGLPFRFPAPRFASPEVLDQQLSLDDLEPYRTSWDAIGDLRPDPGEDLRMRGKWADLMPSIPEGHNYLWHTERGGGMPLFGWRRRFWSFLLKLAKDQPSWTLQAKPGPATGPFHWSSRLLGMRELCRLQTFPDDVVILGSRRAVQCQAGNAVPSLLAEILAREIAHQLLGLPRRRREQKLLPPDRGQPPKPEAVLPVPEEYRRLSGRHSAHPGTGLGFGAKMRLAESAGR